MNSYELNLTASYLFTGLELAIIQGIVKVHEGKIHVESKNTQGTKIIIKLPIVH